MLSFKSYLVEAKNTHMEHIEDMIFNDGVDGARLAINFLRDLRDMLAGNAKSAKNITVKWDGAPAIFAGVDPSDGKFFVGTKGVFAKSPKLVKSLADVKKQGYPAGLAVKVAEAFTEFSKLGIKKGVYQGDLMFGKGDVKVETIKGEKYYTFQPNTIVYAVPVKSSFGAIIRKSKVGVVWHTTYTGNSLENMSASFGKDIVNKMKEVPTVWMDDANYKDVSGNATFTAEETKEITALLSKAGSTFNKVSGDVLRTIAGEKDLKDRIKTYNNTFVRAGEPFPEPGKHVSGLVDYIRGYYQKEIDKKKTEKGKKAWEEKRDQVMRVFSNPQDLKNIFEMMNYIVQAKAMVVAKLNNAAGLGTFLRTASGFKATNQEGYVAIDNIDGAIKLVDRLEFSRANFSPDVIKGWQR